MKHSTNTNVQNYSDKKETEKKNRDVPKVRGTSHRLSRSNTTTISARASVAAEGGGKSASVSQQPQDDQQCDQHQFGGGSWSCYKHKRGAWLL
jgi:hypothetical protein